MPEGTRSISDEELQKKQEENRKLQHAVRQMQFEQERNARQESRASKADLLDRENERLRALLEAGGVTMAPDEAEPVSSEEAPPRPETTTAPREEVPREAADETTAPSEAADSE